MKKSIYYIVFLLASQQLFAQADDKPCIQIIGIAQDGGYPHMGCTKPCCEKAWQHDSLKKFVVSFAITDPASKKWWLFEATPDIKEQLHYFRTLTKERYNYLPEGIFITHAHIGHYTGLMELGREVMNTKDIPVYVLPKMKTFLETNGPWSQLVKLHNIELRPIDTNTSVKINDRISVLAFIVPHRDEYSETAGFKINISGKKYLFISDINQWEKWNKNIVNEVKSVDIAFLDATFYDNTELQRTRLAVVRHPYVTETMKLFENEAPATKSKIYFIHLNHTNPLLWDSGKQAEIEKAGFHVAKQGEEF